MTSIAWLFAVLTAGFALADWLAVATKRSSWRPITKPATLVALIAVAVCVDPIDPATRTVMVVGLVFSLMGDVALLGSDRWFVVGLTSFLIGHLAYVVALQFAPRSPGWTAAGVILVAMAAALVGRPIITTVATSAPPLTVPVIAYIAVISTMVVSAFGTAATWAVAGASLFYLSDAILAWNRFVSPLRWGPLAVMVTYHLGQAGLVGWLVSSR